MLIGKKSPNLVHVHIKGDCSLLLEERRGVLKFVNPFYS